MRCEGCGRDLPEGAAFCPECGERTPTLSAGEMVSFAHTGGLVRGRQATEVPEAPEVPEMPGGVPEIPEPAPLPDAPERAVPGDEASGVEGADYAYLDRARLREEKRRAAQALVESAQIELREELEELAQKEALIEAAAYEADDAYRTDEPPPPPPPSAEERMWAETRERARLHGLTPPIEAQEERGETRGRSVFDAVRPTGGSEPTGQNCCAYGCVTLFVLTIAALIVGTIINILR